MSDFKELSRLAKAGCTASSTKARKQCTKDKRRDLKQNRKRCKEAFSDCRTCCRTRGTDCRVPVEIITLGTLYDRLLAEGGGLDSDLDRLPDTIEAFLGTDPYSRDSDGDGIQDYNEIFGFGYFDQNAVIPDSNGDGIIDANDREHNDRSVTEWLLADNDGDSIPNYLEYYGYTYDWMSGLYELWNGQSLARPYYKTDPLQPSTDQDPYGDATETSGTLMDVSVRKPGSLPMVPGYPNIVIRLEGYEVTLNQEITISEGESLATETNWSRSTTSESSYSSEKSMEHGWSVGVGYSYETPTVEAPAGKHTISVNVGAHGTYGSKSSSTNTRASTRSTGNSITKESNWQKATCTNPTDAAHMKLFLKVYNHGTSAASNIVPTFTLKIGGMNIATFEQAQAQINILEPGGVYPPQRGTYWVIDAINTGGGATPIALTLEELRALELGAPISVVMTQMLADVMLMNSEGRWERAGNWGEYMARCEAVSANLFLDIGDGNFIHYLVYSGDSPTSPVVTFRDALMWVAGGSMDGEDHDITFFDRLGEERTVSLRDWTFNFDLETLAKNGFTLSGEDGLVPPIKDYNVANLVLGPDTVIVGKPPRSADPDAANPVIHYAYLDEVMDVVRVCASDYSGIERVTFQASSTSPPREMEEIVFSSGVYLSELDSSYVSTGSETVTVFSNDPSASPATSDVVTLQYPVGPTPVPPVIHSVYFQPNNHFLSCKVTVDPEYTPTSVEAYHHLLENGKSEMTLGNRFWEKDRRYYVVLENIGIENYYGLTIVVRAQGPGGETYDTYLVTADDIIGDGYRGDVDLISHYRTNSHDCYGCTAERWASRNHPAQYRDYLGAQNTQCNIVSLDLDKDNSGTIGETPNWSTPDVHINDAWGRCAEGAMGYEPDLSLLMNDSSGTMTLRFARPFCIYDGSASFTALDRLTIEGELPNCMEAQDHIVIDGDPDQFQNKTILTRTTEGSIAKIQLWGLELGAVNTSYYWTKCCGCCGAWCDGSACKDCGSCVWRQRRLHVRYVTFADEICSDGIDNDRDFRIDCEDGDCYSNPSCTNPEVCNNGEDDDRDGYIDCFDLDDCKADVSCKSEICDDSMDNDGDGLVDCEDDACSAFSDYCPELLCSDGLDNNNDGLVDCEDRGCCGNSVKGCPDEQGACCADGIDNDGVDGMDCEDPKCKSHLLCGP